MAGAHCRVARQQLKQQLQCGLQETSLQLLLHSMSANGYSCTAMILARYADVDFAKAPFCSCLLAVQYAFIMPVQAYVHASSLSG